MGRTNKSRVCRGMSEMMTWNALRSIHKSVLIQNNYSQVSSHKLERTVKRKFLSSERKKNTRTKLFVLLIFTWRWPLQTWKSKQDNLKFNFSLKIPVIKAKILSLKKLKLQFYNTFFDVCKFIKFIKHKMIHIPNDWHLFFYLSEL